MLRTSPSINDIILYFTKLYFGITFQIFGCEFRIRDHITLNIKQIFFTFNSDTFIHVDVLRRYGKAYVFLNYRLI